jgi:predicted acetyltransferase
MSSLPSPDSTFDIRLVNPSDESVEFLSNYAFSDTPAKPASEEDRQRRAHARRDDKVFASYVDDEPVAKVAVLPMTMNVRGVVMPMGGISGVASMPAGRRRGHVRTLMGHAINAMREDGQPVSALYPFRESFYERFGYTGWPAARWAHVSPAKLGSVLKIAKTGTVRQRMMKDAFDDWTALLKERQQHIDGFSLRGPARHEGWATWNDQWVTTVHEGDRVTGAIVYSITDNLSAMPVIAALWSTINAQYQLLDFIARHVDQVKEARICLAPGTAPELWLTDAEPTVTTDSPEGWNGPMARIVSIDGIAGIRAGDGEITVKVTDPQAPWNEGVWSLRGVGGTLEVTQDAGAIPQAELTIQALSALVFTGIDPAMLRFRGWGDPDEASSDILRSLFPPTEPFLFDLF